MRISMRLRAIAVTSIAILATLVTYARPLYAQAEHEAQQDIQATYDFDASALTTAERSRTAQLLAGLWRRFAEQPGPYRAALRVELLSTGKREALYCDGGMLLLSQTTSNSDQSLALASIRKCSLAEIQQTPYFKAMHALAVRGADTFEWQLAMLAKPSYTVNMDKPVVTFAQEIAFAYPLLIQDEQRYVTRLVERLRKEQEPNAQKTLIRTLWYAATRESEAAIRLFAVSAAASAAAKSEAKQLLGRISQERKWPTSHDALQAIRSTLKVPAKPTEASLRVARRERMNTISTEALRDLEGFTTLLYRIRSQR